MDIRLKEINLKFELQLNIESFGKHVKGDKITQHIPVFSEKNGLVRYAIDPIKFISVINKEDEIWDIISCEILENEEPKLKTQSIDKPVGDFIMESRVSKQQSVRGDWFHYGDVCTLLKKFRTAEFNGKKTIEVPADKYDEVMKAVNKILLKQKEDEKH